MTTHQIICLTIACILVYCFIGMILSRGLFPLSNWAFKMSKRLTHEVPDNEELFFLVFLWPMMIVIIMLVAIGVAIKFTVRHLLNTIRWFSYGEYYYKSK